MRRTISIEEQKVTVPANAEPAAADTYEAHAILAADKLDLKDLDLRERAFLGTCQDIYRNSRGTATPFENFITTVIRWAMWGNPPTPESLIEEIKTELEGDFELTLHSVKRFIRNYPDLRELQATPEPPAAPETTQSATKPAAKAQRTRKRKLARRA
jgi:hypothetical protein